MADQERAAAKLFSDPDLDRVLQRQALRDPSNPEKAEDKKARLEHQQKVDHAYRQIFNSDLGKLILQDLEHKCFFKKNCFGKDDRTTYFNLGLQEVIHHIHKKKELNTKVNK